MKYNLGFVKVGNLQVGDVVKAFDGPWGTAIVKKIEDGTVTFFRPYGISANFSYRAGVVCYVGIEDFSHLNNDKEVYVYQRKDIA